MLPGPVEKENIEAAAAAATDSFRLSHIVTSPTSHKTLTTMPSATVLQKLDSLRSRALAGKVKRTLIEIYSYVTQRIPDEGADHFFIHVGATVHYENFSNCFIKGCNHGLKAAGVANNIQSTLNDIKDVLASPYCDEADRALLTLFKNLLIVHKNAIYRALKNTSAETKAHIKTYMAVDADAYEMVLLTPDELVDVISCYPPNEEKRTPKRKTKDTHDSIRALGAIPPFPKDPKCIRRRLVLSEENIPAAAAPAGTEGTEDDDNAVSKSATSAGQDNLESLFASIVPPSLTWAFEEALPSSWRANLDDSFGNDEGPESEHPSAENSDSEPEAEAEGKRIEKRRGKF